MSRYRAVSPSRIAAFSSLLVAAVAVSAHAEGPIKKLALDRDAPVVGLFEGIERDVLEVRVSPKDAFESNVFITNASQQSLTIAVPATVAAFQVLPQLGPFGPQTGSNSGTSQTQGSAQGVGGQLSPFSSNTSGFPQTQGNQPGAGNNFFSIPPEKTVQLKLHSVCLDHGKPHPMSKMTYVLRTMEDQTDDPVLQAFLAQFDPQRSDRMAVQAAAWHLANGLSWKTLKEKQRNQIGLPPRPYFTKAQLEAAERFVEQAEKAAKQQREAAATSVADKKL